MRNANWNDCTNAELLLAAIIAGVARWEPFSGQTTSGEICVRGIRSCAHLSTLNGTPSMDDRVREDLIVALVRHYG